MMDELQFNEETHTYTLNGVVLTSVSELIAPLGEDMDELEIDLGNTLDRARERGVVCHGIAECLLQNEECDYPEEYEPYVEALQKLFADHSVIPFAIETPLYSKYLMLAGTPDLLCEYDGDLAILDYKFVSKVCKPKVLAQLNAYRLLYEERGVHVDRLIAVQFLPTGAYRAYETALDMGGLNACLALREARNAPHARGRIGK